MDDTTEFFSEGNGYCISILPENYRKVLKPSPCRSAPAVRARNAIVNWIRMDLSRRQLQEFEKGWDEVRDSVTPEQNFHPDYEETQDQDFTAPPLAK